METMQKVLEEKTLGLIACALFLALPFTGCVTQIHHPRQPRLEEIILPTL